MPRTRLIVADDDPLIIDRLVLMLGDDFDVVARAGNGAEVVDSTLRLAPDLLVLDISMPVMNGLRAAEQLREQACKVPIVFLTVHDDRDFADAARAAGGLGYVLKSHMGSDLIVAIRSALAGQPFASAPVSTDRGPCQ